MDWRDEFRNHPKRRITACGPDLSRLEIFLTSDDNDTIIVKLNLLKSDNHHVRRLRDYCAAVLDERLRLADEVKGKSAAKGGG